MPLVVHTAALQYTGADRLDIRTDSSAAGAAAFRPSAAVAAALAAAGGNRPDLGDRGDRESGDNWGAARERYLAELRIAWRRDRSQFSSLLERGEVTLVCDCRDAERCHRRVLAEVLVKLGAEDRGERALAAALPAVATAGAAERAIANCSTASWKDQPWVVLDCETTGLDSEVERIIEIAFCRVENRRIVERASWLLDPEMPVLPPIITEITGLRIEDLRGQPRFAEISGFVVERLASAPVIAAYNVPFDRSFVAAELRRSLSPGTASSTSWSPSPQWPAWPPWPPWVDPMVFIKQFDRYEKSRKLTEAAARRGIVVEGNAHRALADAEMAALVLLAIVPQLPDDLSSLIEMQERWRVEQEADYQAWKARQLQQAQ